MVDLNTKPFLIIYTVYGQALQTYNFEWIVYFFLGLAKKDSVLYMNCEYFFILQLEE